ncbi:MAG: hypothetical protein U0326_33735 [Polyangiales bacterium]
MRNLLRSAVFATLLPLSACYVGNAPPRSSAPPPAADAGADAAPMWAQCRVDSDCGDDATRVLDAGDPHCAMRPLTPEELMARRCARVCGVHVCGDVVDEVCGRVSCGTCGAGQVCRIDGQACEDEVPAGPQWRVRIEQATVTDCRTAWDLCSVQTPLCSPSLPDPYVRFGAARTPIASNACAARYSFDVGAVPEDSLRMGVTVSLLDDDSPSTDDVICREVHAFTDAELGAGRAEISCANGSVVVTLARIP